MSTVTETLIALFLLSGLMFLATSRLLHCIRIVAFQGILLGILPLAICNWNILGENTNMVSIAIVNIGIKGIALPWLLIKAMHKANVPRELEPMIGYSASLVIGLVLVGVSFIFGRVLPLPLETGCPLAVPVALSGMLFGLFIVIARRKAITQVIGFLLFENGITLFGTALMLEYGLLVELGILLDVFVLVFVMGIAIFQISREFEHIDADKLNHLGDAPIQEGVEE
jgi:hydrogenase-4 component E